MGVSSRSAYLESRKAGRAAYSRYRQTVTKAADSGTSSDGYLITVKASSLPKTTTSSDSSPALQPVVVDPEEQLVFEELKRYGPTTLKATARLLADCRQRFRGANASEVVRFCREVAATFGRNTQNRVGVLLTSVPDYFANYRGELERGAQAARAAAPAEQEDRERLQRMEEAAAYEQATDKAVMLMWQDLTEEEREQRLRIARQALRAEPRWHRISPEEREREALAWALRQLRTEQQQQPSASSAGS